MTVEEVKTQALRLGPRDRASLAQELLASLDSLDGADVEQLWVEEAQRRSAELDGGKARAYPADEVLERARQRRR